MYNDRLRDRTEIQQVQYVTDNGGGFTASWLSILNLPCSARNLSSHALKAYGKDAQSHMLRFFFDDVIPGTQTFRSLYALLTAFAKDSFRVLYNAREMAIVAILRPSQGVHGTQGDVMYVDCEEIPQRKGFKDI